MKAKENNEIIINQKSSIGRLYIGSEESAKDGVLIEQVRGGDKQAFSELVKKYQRQVLRLALRLVGELETAEDVAQESFFKAYQKLNFFEGRSAFKSWLFQITVNTAKNKLRGKRRDFISLDKINLAVSAQAELKLETTALSLLIQKAVSELPERQRLALVLRVFEDLSFKEVAEVMECPYDTAKANYRHALLKLKTQIADEDLLNCFGDSDIFVSNSTVLLEGVEA
ncbi:MAG: sigma-70 family RNA polymerase sigma factor [Pseudomonadota bacterium]|nr:sigma-70 family RNA polymerase sigma factor [Pseudomonadota bacterium]